MASDEQNTFPTLVVFDFDLSLLEYENTDIYVFEQLAPDIHQNMDDIKKQLNLGWTAFMDHLLHELWKKGVTKEDIIQCFRRCPITEPFIESVKLLVENNCNIKILSDANTIYIDTILEASNIKNHINEIVTNPAYFSPEGRLRVEPYHPINHHNCANCPTNLCKGLVMSSFIQKENFSRRIYIGDGKGDFCPCTKLIENDVILAKKGYPLAQLLKARQKEIKAKVIEWQDGHHIRKIFTELFLIK